MKLKRIDIVNFRNHTWTAFDCSDRINALLGENGQGKTNLLEAISYLCLTKGFYGISDNVVLQLGKHEFTVSGEFLGERGTRYEVDVRYTAEGKEKIFCVNRSKVNRLADVIGQFPVVVLSPESGAITLGPPAERRKFMDFAIAQSSRVYLQDLLEYRRVLRQRNKMLLNAKLARRDCRDALNPWNIELIEQGTRLIAKRKAFVQELQPVVQDMYARLAGTFEVPTIKYRPSVEAENATTEESIRSCFENQLGKSLPEEVQTGLTMVGPHRDELELGINNLDLRKYGSQGQHKTFLIALKVAEIFYLQGQRRESPLLLLDDVFGELDPRRSERLLDLVGTLGQAFITATAESVFPSNVQWGSGNRKFFVHNGMVGHVEESRVAY